MSGPEAVSAGEVVEALLSWFRSRERDVPSRGESDPYRIWVMEIMAQQTRIGTVRDHYDRFLARFPDVETLARSDLDQVLKAWEGLGYYARARNLHRAAREVVAAYGGRLPREAERLRRLPGIGPYTAGAISSLAFGRPEPAVDGNTRRVLSRCFDLERASPAELETAACRLIGARPERAAEINQALMDLGGEICLPARPACVRCPIGTACLALARDTVDRRPPRRLRRATPHQVVSLGVVWRRGRVLVARRPEHTLLGGLWEFPGGKVEPGETPAEAAVRELREEMKIEIRVRRRIATVDHAYSHFRVTLHAYHADHVSGEPRPARATAWLWAEPGRLAELAFPAANLRILERLRAGSFSGGSPPDGLSTSPR
ncbi:MAG: A/G-specific adenine glycosylase [Gemmatimonadota bacterium]